MARVGFVALPEEILVQVLENLNGIDLIACTLVCRSLHDIVRDAGVLQYNIQLTLAGAEDCGSSSPLLVVDRLAELKAFQESCATLRFRKREKKWLAMSDVWELFGGFLARGIATDGTRGLAFVELPSITRTTPGRTWEHPDMGVAIRDFTIDPSQDLAVLISHPTMDGMYRIHLKAMSTGQGHPRAVDPALPCVPGSMRRCDFVIQVMDEYLAVLFHTMDRRATDELFIWNWRTGRIVAEMKASSQDKIRIDSFSFISPRHFVISRFESELLRPTTPVLEVYNFVAREPFQRITSIPNLVRTFEFPEVVDNGIILAMLTRSDPPPQRPTSSHLPNSAPFRTATDSRVLAVSLEVIRQRLNVCTYVLFVHHSTLLEGLDHGAAPQNVRMPWEQWGPQKSRMLPTMYNEQTWVCYMHGTRYVRLEPLREILHMPQGSRIRMMDFNPHALHRKRAVTEKGGERAAQYGIGGAYGGMENWPGEMEAVPQQDEEDMQAVFQQMAGDEEMDDEAFLDPDELMMQGPFDDDFEDMLIAQANALHDNHDEDEDEDYEEGGDEDVDVDEDEDADVGEAMEALLHDAMEAQADEAGIEGVPIVDEIFPASRPTCIPADDVFRHDVVTALPYRDVLSSRTYHYSAVMIEEECLVGLLPGASGHAEGFEFLCL